MSKYLSFYGGDRAISIIRECGLTQDIVKIVAGAAGGPKWLILGHMDRFLFSEWFSKRAPVNNESQTQSEHPDPLFLAGSSAGAWRFAAASQSDPVKALERFADSYIHQWYSIKPTLQEIDVECWKVLDGYIDDNGVNEILTHPYCRLSFFSVRSKGGTASDNPLFLTTTMVGAALLNAFDRKHMNRFFQRTLFYNPSAPPPFYDMDQPDTNFHKNNSAKPGSQFPMLKVPLTHENFKKALISSGSIPLVMPGVTDIPATPPGVYRDGGTIDYHLDIPFMNSYLNNSDKYVSPTLPETSQGTKGGTKTSQSSYNKNSDSLCNEESNISNNNEDKIVLFPHYTNKIVPGWLDKHLPWRKPTPENLRNVLLIAPTSTFTNLLPGGKIPDRQDFTRLKHNNQERIERWKLALKYSEILGDELCRVIHSGNIAELIKPIEEISR